jgi:hypothetical protein
VEETGQLKHFPAVPLGVAKDQRSRGYHVPCLRGGVVYIADGTLSLAILAFLGQAFVMSGFL